MKGKIIFWLIFVALLSLIPITILPNVNLGIASKSLIIISNLFQRFIGLTLFVLSFWQIILGSNMERFTNKLGPWVLKFHIFEGVTIYLLAIFHGLSFLAFRHFSGQGTDPIFIFLGFCVYCQTIFDFYYTLGRIAFWLLTVGVFAGLYRGLTPFMRANWRKFHVLNYLVFLIVGIHGLSVGTDFMIMPFFIFAILSYLIVLYTVIRKLPSLFLAYKNWINK